MTSLQNGNYNSRSMNGLTEIYANDINCDTITTIDATITRDLKVGGDTELQGKLTVIGLSDLATVQADTLTVSGDTDISTNLWVGGQTDLSGDLTVVGITNTTTLNANTLTVSGDTDISSNLWVGGKTDLSGNLTVVGNYTSPNGNIILTNGTVSASSMTATNFFGTATNAENILATTDNSSGNYYIPFIKTAGTGNKELFIDDTTAPITINPSTGDIRMIGLKNDVANTSIALGVGAGTGQGTNVGCIAIGNNAGSTSQGNNAVAIGPNAGRSQNINAFALGRLAGEVNQGVNAVAIGIQAGQNNQGNSGIGIGEGAGQNSQGQLAVGIGILAGRNQLASAVAIGNQAGRIDQLARAVAIGALAGYSGQGQEAIAIGYLAGQTSQAGGSIAINASGIALNPSVAGLFVRPIRGVDLKIGIGNLFYNTTTFELQYSTTNPTAVSATEILITQDNTAGTYYIPFAKSGGTGNKPLFIDDTTGALTFNPSTGRLRTEILDSSETYTGYIKTPSIEAEKVTFYDGEAMRSYSQQSVNDIDIANYMSGQKATKPIKITTYDYSIANNTATLYAPNILVFGLVRLTKGVQYTGVYFQTGTLSINCKVVLYRSGLNPTVLAQRTTNYTTTSVGFQFVPFDAPYTPTSTTDQFKYAYIGFVSASNVALYTMNNNNTNFGSSPTPNTFDLVAFSIPHTYANAFPSPYVGTPTALNLKYHLGLY